MRVTDPHKICHSNFLMFLRQLSKLTASLNKLMPQSQHIHVPRFYYAKGVEDTGETESASHRDQLSLSLNSLPADEIITTLKAKEDLITGSHIIVALNNLFLQLKHFHETERGRDILRKFEPILIQNKSKLSGQQTVDVIKMLDQLQVQKSSRIYPAMLQHIFDCLDDLSFKNLCELWDSILDQKINHLLKHDLQAALRKKLLMKLSMDFDRNDLEFLRYALHYISQISQSPKRHALAQIFIKKIVGKSSDIIPLDMAISMYISLYSLEYTKLKVEALHKVQNDLAEQAYLLDQHQIREIIKRMQKAGKADKLEDNYNEQFANALAKRVVDGNFGAELAISVLSKLNKLRHKSPELLQYCCTEVSRELGITHHERKMNLMLRLLEELALAKHRAAFLDEIPNSLWESAMNSCQNSESLVFLASDLMSLNCFSNPVVEKLFDGSLNPSSLKTTSRIFCKIYQILKLDPSYNGPLPTDSQMADLELLLRKNHYARKYRSFPLLIHLEKGMKDLTCIQTDVKTGFFHEFDHVVAVYQDGTPAPIRINPSASSASNDIKFIEDLTVPPGAKLVIVQFLLHSWFFRNTNELLGDYQTSVDAMEMLPYPVVFVNESTWTKVPVNERTSYIMNAIKAKLDSAH